MSAIRAGGRSAILLLAKGFCMGSADVVPGVSGGTMALILGIYQRLLEAIRAFDLELLSYLGKRRLQQAVRHVDLPFLAPLGLGIFLALMFFTRVVSLPALIQQRPEMVYGLFFGLIAASVVWLLLPLRNFGLRDLVWLGLGAALGLAVVNLTPVTTPETAWFVFASGALAICAMILPGISGSFILLLLRKYAYVFDAIGRLDFSVLLPFACGAIAGLMLFSRLLVWLLRRCHRQALLVITGVLIGSLWMMWPFQARTYVVVRGKSRLVQSTPVWPDQWDHAGWWALALMVLGMVTVLALGTLASKRRVSA
jgi:putative membrane protein